MGTQSQNSGFPKAFLDEVSHQMLWLLLVSSQQLM
jgi:hypothetical protein